MFDYLQFEHVSTPYDPNIKLMKNYGESESELKYSQKFATVMYLSSCTKQTIPMLWET